MQSNLTQEQLIKSSAEVIQSLKEYSENTKWEPNGEKPCKMFKMGVQSRIASKGVATVEGFSISQVASFLEDLTLESKRNVECTECKILQKLEALTIFYMRFKGIGPVSDRDFVLIQGSGYENNLKKRYYNGSKSIDFAFPEQKGAVRAELFVGGYIIDEIQPKKLQITYVSDADAKGLLPGFVKNLVSQYQGEVAARIGPLMHQMYGKK